MTVRPFCFLLIHLFVFVGAYAQKQKEVYGSFEAGCRVFNYHFKQSSNQINGFVVSEIGKNLELLDLDDKKLDTTFRFFGALTQTIEDTLSKESTSEDDRLRFDSLKTLLNELMSVVRDAKERVLHLSEFAQQSGAVDSLYQQNLQQPVDTLVQRLYGRAPESTYYSVTNLVVAVHGLVEKLQGKEQAEYTYFNEFRPDVFEQIFLSYMKPYVPSFSSRCDTNLTRLAAQVFGSIKARLDFFDDEPVTAYLRLKGKRIRVYINNDVRKAEAQKQRDRLAEKKEAIADMVAEWNVKTGEALTDAEKSALQAQRKRDRVMQAYRQLVKDSNDLQQLVDGYGKKDAGGRGYKPVHTLVYGSDYLVFDIENVSVEFEDGNLKNLFADLSYTKPNGEKLFVRFRNNLPVSVSNKFDPEEFEQNWIFASKPCEVYRALRNKGFLTGGTNQLNPTINDETNCEQLHLLLSDLLEYLVVAETDKEDYSPANRVYELNEQNPVQQLKKEKRSKILLLKAYSDFVGIDDDQPNGLIQFEASKRINLLTHRYPLSSKNYAGIFTYIEPKIIFSKLEQNNKYLFLDRTMLDTTKVIKENIKQFSLDPLQLYQYANFSIQTDFNLFKLNWSAAKSNFQVNGHFGYFRTAVSDSLNVVDSAVVSTPVVRTDNINSRTLGLSLVWEFKPDSRYGISFGWDLRRLKPYSDAYSITEGFDQVIHTLYFDGYLNTNNDDGRLFFRVRFNQLFHQWSRNFMQVQAGYALNIFKAQ